MEAQVMSDFQLPELRVGNLVLFYSDPIGTCEPMIGWVLKKPGIHSISILCFSEATGFVEKTSVRHREDPFWRESESASAWQKWGCFEVHPDTIALQSIPEIATKLKIMLAKESIKK